MLELIDRRPEGVQGLRVEPVEVEPVQNVKDPFVVVLARKLGDLNRKKKTSIYFRRHFRREIYKISKKNV
jgi:hypothetical protein